MDGDRPSVSLSRIAPRRLLGRILDEPQLIEAVRRLPAPALARVIDHVGLEDAGELVALASSAQLGLLLDEDVWRSARPGEDERFDAGRFALWLEVLQEAGDQVAAQKLADLPEELVTLAMQRQLLVIDIDALAVQMAESSDDNDLLEKALDSGLQHEFDQYRVIARQHEGWDALLQLLIALDRDHRELFERLMERCCAATMELADDSGGWLELLTEAEEIESDAAAEREDRRAREGYVSPSQAAAFLKLARQTDLEAIRAQKDRDPITRAYFREYAPSAHKGAARATDSRNESPAGSDGTDRNVADSRLGDLLRDSGVLDESKPAGLLEAGTSARPADETRFADALRLLAERDPEAHTRRLDELGFLANVLLAGATVDGKRRFRPLEAAEAVTALCNLGLDYELRQLRIGTGQAVTESAVGIVGSTGAERLFRIAVKVLHSGVAIPASVETDLVRMARGAIGRAGGGG